MEEEEKLLIRNQKQQQRPWWWHHLPTDPIMQQHEQAVVRQQLDLLIKALDARCLIRHGDLGEAGAIKVGSVVDPGLGQRRLGSAGGAGGRGGQQGGEPPGIGESSGVHHLPHGFSSVVFRLKVFSKL